MMMNDAAPEVSLLDKVAIVTGAGRGFGRCIALGLAESGAAVVAVARGRVELEETVALIRGAGGTAIAVPADISSSAAVDHLARTAATRGTAQIVINAAGIFGPLQHIASSSPTEWIETISTNTIGPYLVCRAFLPGMIRSGWGRIVNLSSAASLHEPEASNSAYAVSKVALNQFTRNLAVEIDGTGVTANVIHPGDVKTSMFEDIRREVLSGGDASTSSYAGWIAWMEETGGDPEFKARDLVLRIIESISWHPNGEFLWIDDPLQPPIFSWNTRPEVG
jgi:NAD(P)-dependent dehydrogenase (short-subunit alcohol dehydrogenase family)